jgi:hypothetical protein
VSEPRSFSCGVVACESEGRRGSDSEIEGQGAGRGGVGRREGRSEKLSRKGGRNDDDCNAQQNT